MTRPLLIKGGRVIDPSSETDGISDLLVKDGLIAAISENIECDEAIVSNAEGLWVVPGFIDLRSHLREPGEEYKEDFSSGGKAAAAGGFTAVAVMARTSPINDDPSVTHYILERAREKSPVRILPIAAATRGLRGEVMTEMDALVRAGAVAVSDDNQMINNSGTMRRVLEYATLVGIPVVVHAEDRTLVGAGTVHEGSVSTRLGLTGSPAIAEASVIARDIMLASLTGAHVHVAHVSSSLGVDLIRNAKKNEIRITAEVTPHHLMLTDENCLEYDTNTKVLPPLRSFEDRAALREGISDGTLDVIVTDHAPHADQEKETDFQSAPPGMIGLETAFSVLTPLLDANIISPMDLFRRLSTEGARILSIPGGTLAVGASADLAVVAPQENWRYESSNGNSKSRNSPWSGQTLKGRVRKTMVSGKIVFDIDEGASCSVVNK